MSAQRTGDTPRKMRAVLAGEETPFYKPNEGSKLFLLRMPVSAPLTSHTATPNESPDNAIPIREYWKQLYRDQMDSNKSSRFSTPLEYCPTCGQRRTNKDDGNLGFVLIETRRTNTLKDLSLPSIHGTPRQLNGDFGLCGHKTPDTLPVKVHPFRRIVDGVEYLSDDEKKGQSRLWRISKRLTAPGIFSKSHELEYQQYAAHLLKNNIPVSPERFAAFLKKDAKERRKWFCFDGTKKVKDKDKAADLHNGEKRAVTLPDAGPAKAEPNDAVAECFDTLGDVGATSGLNGKVGDCSVGDAGSGFDSLGDLSGMSSEVGEWIMLLSSFFSE